MAEKWVLKTTQGEIDVSHLTNDQIAKVQTDLAMLRFFSTKAVDLTRQNVNKSVLKRNKKGV